MKIHIFLVFFAAAFLFSNTVEAQSVPAKNLAGLWEAKRRFGSDTGGLLVISQSGGEWRAEIAGRGAAVKLAAEAVSFELPDGGGAFQGRFAPNRAKITGHWIQPATVTNGTPYASPVTLAKDRQNTWRGEVSPLADEYRFYLMITPREDGSAGAFLKNPERNLGRFIRVDRIESDGANIKLLAADSENAKGRVLAEGKYDAENDAMSIYFPSRGGSFDFRRVGANQTSDFYPRGRAAGVKYSYAAPPAFDDGWQTASLETVGISRAEIEKFIRMIIDTPINSVGAPEIHGVLVARHGKLVLEEYFHGENREKPHDTRSAAKSLTATLFGAAVSAGIAVDASSPVYKAMNGGVFPADIEPPKKTLLMEHLLTQTSGLDCDDADEKSPGNEQNLLDQTDEPDYYKYTLGLKMIRNPGEKAVYCSVQPNLIGGVLQRASQQSLPTLFQKLLAEPLQIKKYYLNLTPTGDAYMGGGARFLPRDFMKLGQLMLDGGVWNGRRILTPEYSRRAASALVEMKQTLAFNWKTNQIEMGTRKYGYLWWIENYPYKGKTVRAFFAGGNGGQIVMTIPELDLVIAFYGGNYSDRATFTAQWIYVPQFILPAVNN